MLVKKNTPVRTYELTYLVGAGYTAGEISSVQDQVTALIGKYKGKIVEVIDWGKKNLAYTIHQDGKPHTEANYTHMIVEMPADKSTALQGDLKLKKEIMRSLLIVAENKKVESEKSK